MNPQPENTVVHATHSADSATPAHRLLERLAHPETLHHAWRLVRRGGDAPGVDGHTLAHFEKHADAYICELATRIRTGRFHFQPVRRVWIAKPCGGRRRLGIPTICDRIVQQALRQIIQPSLQANFANCSFAYRDGRSAHHALQRLRHQLRCGHVWILETDIQDFFDSVHHPTLLRNLHRDLPDPRLLPLIQQFLTCGVRLHRRWFPTRKGLPQGSPLSPLLANYYLTPFDRAVAAAGFALIRYADDLLVCCPNHKTARHALQTVLTQLRNLRLRINPRKTNILDLRTRPVDFLGFSLTADSCRPSASSTERLAAQIQQILQQSPHTHLPEVVRRLNPLLRSFAWYFSPTTDDLLLQRIEQSVQNDLLQFARQTGQPVPSADTRWSDLGLVSLTAHVRRFRRHTRPQNPPPTHHWHPYARNPRRTPST